MGPRIALLAAYVLISSLLGLSGRAFFVGEFDDGIAFFGKVWSESVAADLVFILTAGAAGVASVALARRNQALGVLAAFPLHWGAYVVSCAILLWGGDEFGGLPLGLGGLFHITLVWGFPGLIFGAVAPLVYVAQQQRAQAAAAPLAGGPD